MTDQKLAGPRHVVLPSLLYVVIGCITAAWAGLKPDAAGHAVTDPANSIVATIGDERITEAQIIAADKSDFDHLAEDIALRRKQLQEKELESRYRLLQQQTDKLLDSKALELEAKARDTTPEALMSALKVPAVTDEEARAFYETNKSRANGRTFEQLQAEITQHLAAQHNSDAVRSYLDELRARHRIVSRMPPFRLAVDATGPSRGKDRARVTIVEFGDFQCPFCRQEQPVLDELLLRHPEDVRLVFRQLPLVGIHPSALGAAHAAVCADQQGKFWPMHDAMYQDQNALGTDGLVETARRLGLDGDRFSSCLSSSEAADAVERDAKAADELNINETPYFFINGRPLHGAVPIDKIEAIVNEELQRSTSSQHG